MALTLFQLIELYRTDADSPFRKLSYQVRIKQDRMLARIVEKHGKQRLGNIRARTLLDWHRAWSSGGKIAIAAEFIARLRPMFRFGFAVLEDQECYRLLQLLREMRFPRLGPRFVPLTGEHVQAIRIAAHEVGYPSIALAQAFQFELKISQKDVIGEWVPANEPTKSQLIHSERKWLRGLQWSSVDQNCILRHAIGSSGRPIQVDLKTTPMVLEEFNAQSSRQSDGPIIICELTGVPWTTSEFRRNWRLIANRAGVPDTVKNRDSVPAGMIAASPDGVRVSRTITLKDIDYSLRKRGGGI